MIKAEYIDYMEAYRIYSDRHPADTMAYEDSKPEVIRILTEENGYMAKWMIAETNEWKL